MMPRWMSHEGSATLPRCKEQTELVSGRHSHSLSDEIHVCEPPSLSLRYVVLGEP